MPKPIIEDFVTVLDKDNTEPLFDLAWGAFKVPGEDAVAKTPAEGREALDAYSRPEVDALVASITIPDELTTDELAAINGANAPDGVNVFATMDDLPKSGRTLLTEDTTWYIDGTLGSDSNDGLSSGVGAFATIQRAVDVICGLYDLGSYQPTISVADGTYTAGVVLRAYVGQNAPIIQGNATTPANVVISTPDAACFSNSALCPWIIKDMKLTTSGSHSCLFANTPASTIRFSGIDFGATGSSHIEPSDGALIYCDGDYTISGSAIKDHIRAARGGTCTVLPEINVTITGTPNFTRFISAYTLSNVRYSPTISGSATGTRYYVLQNAVIDVFGNTTTYLPGDKEGIIEEGGVYT
jgi:hypothetical protein